jgi:hypothetical protein
MRYQNGGPFGDPMTPRVEEVAIGGVALKLSFVDETREKLEAQGVDVVALTQDVGGGLRRRWKAVDEAGHVSWGRSRTEAMQKALGRALGGSKRP